MLLKMTSNVVMPTRSRLTLQTSRELSTSSLAEFIRPITLRTCVNLYPQLHRLNPSIYPLKAPKDGLELTVNYLDTANNCSNPNNFNKVIFAIPGAAGSFMNFEKIITYFSKSTTRVIAPNLPDFSHTRQNGGVFWHSTLEKATFLKDLLRQINVQQIDCILGHSMAMHTILAMCDEPESLQIKSAILFSPQPLYDLSPTKSQLTQRLLFSFRSELWFQFLDLIKLHKWSWIHSYSFSNLNDFLLFWMPSLDLQTPRDLPKRIYNIRNQSQQSVAIVYGSKEKFVSQKSIQMLLNEFTINQSDVQVLNSDSVLNLHNTRFRAFIIENGGHFAHSQFPNVTNAIIDNMLQMKHV